MARSTAYRTAKRQAKKYARKNQGFLVCLALCLVLGVAAGFATVFMLGKNDGFTLYHDGKAYEGEQITIASGTSYDHTAASNAPKIVVWGKDMSAAATVTISYVAFGSDEVVTVDSITADGTYYLVYRYDNAKASGLTALGGKKFEQTALKKTIVVGEQEVDNG